MGCLLWVKVLLDPGHPICTLGLQGGHVSTGHPVSPAGDGSSRGGSEVGGGGSPKLTPQSQGSKRLGVCEPRAHPSFMGKCHR